VEAESFGGDGVVTAAFGDVEVAGVFYGRDDGGADDGQGNGLVPFHDGDVMGFLVLDQPVQVSPTRYAGRRRSLRHRPGPGFQEFGELAGLVVLDAELKIIQQAPAVSGDA
jgi:hypothetical protein